jgi:S-DNA-T family DNA segregation ATPase FtsK/SpoIIIE
MNETLDTLPAGGPGSRREIPGLLLLVLGLALSLALVSHDPSDPSLTGYSTQTDGVRNYIGLAGAYASSILIDLLGLASFWPVVILWVYSWRCFRGRPLSRPRLAAAALVLMLPVTAALSSLVFPRLTWFWDQTPGGGLVGDLLARYLVHLLGGVGAWLLLAALVLTSLIMATGLSFIRAASRLAGRLVGVGRRSPAAVVKNKPSAPVQKTSRKKAAKSKPAPRPAPRPEPAPPDRDGAYHRPPAELLDEPQKSAGRLTERQLSDNARLLEAKLKDFNVDGQVVDVLSGPVITMYEYRPAPGVKISKVAGLSDDLAMNLKAEAIRIVAPLPGKAALGVEIPNPDREIVYLKEVVDSPVFTDAKSLLSVVLGVDTMGEPMVADLAKMPHLLIAGATGAGKSVGLNAIIMSILLKAAPDQVRFLMIDPKRIELTLYKELPHLIYPVISDPKEANTALKWAVADMEQRYKLLAEKGVRNIDQYNRKIAREIEEYHKRKAAQPAEGEAGSEEDPPPEPLPYLVVIIDELADLMVVSAKEVETSITRLAQMARAAGIHLILATQRPSVDVLTGVIKANMPTRISFQVSSKIDSRTILDSVGAEKLLGRGDMLYLPPGTGKIQRVHGAYVSEEETQRITDYIRAQRGPDYLTELELPSESGDGEGEDQEYDEKYDEAVELVTQSGKASISLIQRHLRIGYNRAARIIEVMEKEGVVGPADGAKPRQVLAGKL